jgi:hypothetical protein
MAVSPFLAGLQPGGLVTHEDTPPFLYFHTFWLYLEALERLAAELDGILEAIVQQAM